LLSKQLPHGSDLIHQFFIVLFELTVLIDKLVKSLQNVKI